MPRKVPANDAYRIEAMPVPAVLVTLKGGKGGLLIEEENGKEVRRSTEIHIVLLLFFFYQSLQLSQLSSPSLSAPV